MGLRVPGWDLGASGARPQATVWVFDLRTSWHLEKLLVPGVGLGMLLSHCGGSFCYPRGGGEPGFRKESDSPRAMQLGASRGLRAPAQGRSGARSHPAESDGMRPTEAKGAVAFRGPRLCASTCTRHRPVRQGRSLHAPLSTLSGSRCVAGASCPGGDVRGRCGWVNP